MHILFIIKQQLWAVVSFVPDQEVHCIYVMQRLFTVFIKTHHGLPILWKFTSSHTISIKQLICNNRMIPPSLSTQQVRQMPHACKRIYCTFPLCALHGFKKKYVISRSSTSHISFWLIYWVLREDYISFEFFRLVVECGYTQGKQEELWNIIPWPTWWGEFIFDSLTKCDFIFFQQSLCAHIAAVLYAAQFLSV